MRAIRFERQSMMRLVFLALVLSLSLGLRLADLDRYLTADEGSWEDRSRAFRQALQSGDLAKTYQSKHPGVVTMWLGAAADVIVSHQSSDAAEASSPAGVSDSTLWARRLVALVTWLGIVALYPLLRTFFDPPTALTAVALVALDPFFLGHSRVHHLDGLLTTLVMLSAISLLAFRRTGRRSLLVLSGICGGLAAIAKAPGVFLVPWAALALWVPGSGETSGRSGGGSGRPALLALWGVSALAAALVAWPALWVAPVHTISEMWAGLAREAGQPHATGAFFWGAAREDPGGAYYPVVWIFRTTPWVVLGLVGLAARRRSARWRDLLLLGALALVFGVGVTLSPKKFDRYLLPVFLLVDIIAAVGLVTVFRRIFAPRLSAMWRRPSAGAAMLLVVVSQWALIWPARPYYTSYYDPLVGGARTAPRILQTGWGEGLDLVGTYLNGLPDAGDQLIASQWPKLLEPFALGTVERVSQISPWKPDFVVLASSQAQRSIDAEAVAHYYGSAEPVFTASSDGVPYAWVYANDYGDTDWATLTSLIGAEANPQETAILMTSMPAYASHYQGEFQLINLEGTSRCDYLATVLREQLGDRRHVWLLQDPSSDGEADAVLRGLLDARGQAGPVLTAGALQATAYDLPEGAEALLGEPDVDTDLLFGDRLRLIGYTVSDEVLWPGAQIDLRLYWRADMPGEAAWKVFVHVVGPDGTIYGQSDAVPQGFERPTHTWKLGGTLVDDYHVEIDDDAPVDGLTLRIGMYDGDSLERLDVVDGDGRHLNNGEVILDRIGSVTGQ